MALGSHRSAGAFFHGLIVFLVMDDSTRNVIDIQGNPDPVGLKAVRQLVCDQFIRSAACFEELGSTNTLALSQVQDATCSEMTLPRLLIADRQLAGRGRRGRTWSSDDGTLTFSLIVSFDDPSLRERFIKLGSLAVGLGISRFVEYEFAPLQVKLKWPNDVYLAGGKLAGVLIELVAGKSNFFVIGVGLNVGTRPDLNDPVSLPSVASLSHVLGRSVKRYELLAGIVPSILESINAVETEPSSLLIDFRKRCQLTGHPVEYQAEDGRRTGMCIGVNDSGGLRIQNATGEEVIHSGEANLIRSTLS